MGKHTSEKFSKNLLNNKNQAGFAPQAPRAKMRLSNIARRGK